MVEANRAPYQEVVGSDKASFGVGGARFELRCLTCIALKFAWMLHSRAVLFERVVFQRNALFILNQTHNKPPITFASSRK